MFKFALSALFSLLLVFVPVQAAKAQAAGSNTSAKKSAPKKTVAKKAVAKKSQVVVRKRVAKAERTRTSKRTVVVRGKRKTVVQRVRVVAPSVQTTGDLAGLNLTRDPLDLKSSAALVLDQSNAEVLFEKNANVALPIASITKLMTGLVVIQARQDMDEMLKVTDDDIDREKFTSSRLKIGSELSRSDMLHIALMSSENRAASALGRNYPGGLPAFVASMNAKAKLLGMNDTHYVDSSGLSKLNVASARDLGRLVMAAHNEPLLRKYSTDQKTIVEPNGVPMRYGTTNRLINNPDWDIGLQKTGFINEAGRCLVMQAKIEGRAVIMVFLDSKGTQARAADAGRIRKWLEALKPSAMSLPGG
jgi:D-alanyl-D-alanine endopeptidase (penicillin-binding protein 7)